MPEQELEVLFVSGIGPKDLICFIQEKARE